MENETRVKIRAHIDALGDQCKDLSHVREIRKMVNEKMTIFQDLFEAEMKLRLNVGDKVKFTQKSIMGETPRKRLKMGGIFTIDKINPKTIKMSQGVQTWTCNVTHIEKV